MWELNNQTLSGFDLTPQSKQHYDFSLIDLHLQLGMKIHKMHTIAMIAYEIRVIEDGILASLKSAGFLWFLKGSKISTMP